MFLDAAGKDQKIVGLIYWQTSDNRLDSLMALFHSDGF